MHLSADGGCVVGDLEKNNCGNGGDDRVLCVLNIQGICGSWISYNRVPE